MELHRSKTAVLLLHGTNCIRTGNTCAHICWYVTLHFSGLYMYLGRQASMVTRLCRLYSGVMCITRRLSIMQRFCFGNQIEKIMIHNWYMNAVLSCPPPAFPASPPTPPSRSRQLVIAANFHAQSFASQILKFLRNKHFMAFLVVCGRVRVRVRVRVRP